MLPHDREMSWLVVTSALMALASPEIKERFGQFGAEPIALDQTAFKTLLKDERQMLSTLIKERNIVPD